MANKTYNYCINTEIIFYERPNAPLQLYLSLKGGMEVPGKKYLGADLERSSVECVVNMTERCGATKRGQTHFADAVQTPPLLKWAENNIFQVKIGPRGAQGDPICSCDDSRIGMPPMEPFLVSTAKESTL